MSDDPNANSSTNANGLDARFVISEIAELLSTPPSKRPPPDPGPEFVTFAALRGEMKEGEDEPPPERGWSPEDFWSDDKPPSRPCEGCNTLLLPVRHPSRNKWLVVKWCPACQDADVQASVRAAEDARTLQARTKACGLYPEEIEEARESPAELDPGLTHFLRPPVRSKRWCGMLSGQPGTGKSTQAALAVLHYLAQGWRCLYIQEPDLVEGIIRPRAPDLRRHPDDYAKPDLLVIDEVGRGSRHPDGRAAVLRVLDLRYRKRLPTLLASNLSMPGVSILLGTSYGSRIFTGCEGRALVYTRDWRMGGYEVGPPTDDPQEI